MEAPAQPGDADERESSAPAAPFRLAVGLGFSAGVLSDSVTGHLAVNARLRAGPVAFVAASWISEETRKEALRPVGSQVSLQWLGGSLGVCPLVLEFLEGSVDGCALFSLGGVTGRDNALPEPALGTALYAALELALRGAVTLHRPVFAWGALQGGPIIARPRHVVVWPDRAETVYRAEPWVVHAEAGLGFTL